MGGNVRRGLFRLYVVVSIVWVGWFGYQLYDGIRGVKVYADFLKSDANYRQSGRGSPWDRNDLMASFIEYSDQQAFALKALPVVPVGAPIVYLVVFWIVRGFRVKPEATAALPSALKPPPPPAPQTTESELLKPASTLWLVVSIILTPILWLIDPAAMSNFWVTRGWGKKK